MLGNHPITPVLLATNLAAAREFYHGKLGLQIDREDEKHRPLHIPGRLMRIMTWLIPRSLAVRMNGRMLGRAARTLAHRQVAPAE